MTEEVIRRREGMPTPGIVLELGVSSDSAKESVELLDGGDRAYPAMLSAVAHARKSVDARFVEALGNAVRRGGACRCEFSARGHTRGAPKILYPEASF